MTCYGIDTVFFLIKMVISILQRKPQRLENLFILSFLYWFPFFSHFSLYDLKIAKLFNRDIFNFSRVFFLIVCAPVWVYSYGHLWCGCVLLPKACVCFCVSVVFHVIYMCACVCCTCECVDVWLYEICVLNVHMHEHELGGMHHIPYIHVCEGRCALRSVHVWYVWHACDGMCICVHVYVLDVCVYLWHFGG